MEPVSEPEPTLDVVTGLSPQLQNKIRALCTEFSTERNEGRRPNVAKLVQRIEPEGRSQLLTELFALRCFGLPQEEVVQIAIKWTTVFPEFKGMLAPRLPIESAASVVKEDQVLLSIAQAATPPLSDTASLPLEIYRQIDMSVIQTG